MKSSYTELLEKELASFLGSNTGGASMNKFSMIDCPLCRSGLKVQKELFSKRGYRFVVCNQCGLIFSNPSPLREINRSLYDKSGSCKQWAQISQAGEQIKKDISLYRSLIRLARRDCKRRKTRCLDISMRAGVAQKLFRKIGWESDFYDFSRFTRAIGIKKHTGIKFYDSFAAIAKCGNSYDVVISMEAMEHFVTPRTFMGNVTRILTKGGVFCGVVSNTESMLVRALGSEAPLFDGLYQKFFFHTGSLKRLFKEFNLVSERFDTIIPAQERIEKFFNRIIPEGLPCLSTPEVRKVCGGIKNTDNLGYKLLFVARKGDK